MLNVAKEIFLLLTTAMVSSSGVKVTSFLLLASHPAESSKINRVSMMKGDFGLVTQSNMVLIRFILLTNSNRPKPVVVG